MRSMGNLPKVENRIAPHNIRRDDVLRQPLRRRLTHTTHTQKRRWASSVSIVYGHTSGLVAGDSTKYINKIAYANGKLTATASATAHASEYIANANSTSYTLTDVYAVKSYVEGKISGLGNVMEFKGVIGSTNTYLSNAKVGDVVLVGADATSKWYWDGDEITSSGTNKVQPGQEFVCVSVNASSNIRTWELIGDQNAQTTILGNKAQTGSAYDSLYGLSTSVLLVSDSSPILGL